MTSHSVFGTMIEADAAKYQRQRDLIDKKLIALWPKEGDDYSVAGTEHIIKRLQKVVSAYYGLTLLPPYPHWSYEPSRHVALLSALGGERAMLAHLRNAQKLARILEAAE